MRIIYSTTFQGVRTLKNNRNMEYFTVVLNLIVITNIFF